MITNKAVDYMVQVTEIKTKIRSNLKKKNKENLSKISLSSGQEELLVLSDGKKRNMASHI